MEVKMFIHSRPEVAEANINEWLAKGNVKVSHITQSQSERNGNFVFVISVFYTNNNLPSEIQNRYGVTSGKNVQRIDC